LQRLAGYLEKTARFKLELFSALVYPVLVLLFGSLIATATLVYGSPILSQMYTAAGIQLPLLTRALIASGSLIRTWGPPLVIGVMALMLVAPRATRSLVLNLCERATLGVRPLHQLLMEAAVARSCRTLATLYVGGVPVLRALEMTSQSASNKTLRDIFHNVRNQVASGSNLSTPLLASPLFPPMAAGIILAGETSGSLPRMLEHLADYYETRLDFALKAFTKLVEPTLVVGAGFIIGLIALGLGLPFLNLVAVLN
jgi:type IV pilus assembly protein PilC